MKYNIFLPLADLAHIVKQYVVINSLEEIEKLFYLPDGGNFIVFNRGVLCRSDVYGSKSHDIPKNYSVSIKSNRVKKTLLYPECEPNCISFPLIIVELLPIGFYKLFHMDASILNSGYMEIDPSLVERFFKDLYTHANTELELDYLHKSLMQLNNSHDNTRLCIEDVLDMMINEHQYEISIQSLVKQFDCSRSTMERHFKKYIGLTPKNFIFVSKFSQTLLSYIRDGRTFRDIDYLYSDNSHMNRVFKKILGIVPSEIFSQVLNENIKIYQLAQLEDNT